MKSVVILLSLPLRSHYVPLPSTAGDRDGHDE